MKNLKRIACLVLAVAVVCSLGIVAFAASEDPYSVATADVKGAQFPDVTAANHEEAIYALVALGVFEGYPDGQFKADRIIDRDEFAKIVFYFCGNDEKDLPYFANLKSQFPDVYEGYWAEGYINFAASNGYVIGYPDGTFKPDNKLTMQEAVTVLLRVLGYTDDLKGVWPNDYNRKAVDIGLTKYVDYIGGAPASRDTVASLSYQALDCYKVTYIADKTAANTGYLSGGGAALLGTLYTELKDLAKTYSAQIAAGVNTFSPYIDTALKAISMYGVDDEQYAYMYGRTNEGYYVYYDLLKAAFGATKAAVHYEFPEYSSRLDDQYGDDLIESYGWYVDDSLPMKGKGQLGVSYYPAVVTNIAGALGANVSYADELVFDSPLASTYYLVGGDLTDLGDTDGTLLYNAKGEVIMASTMGRAASRLTADFKAPFYSNYALGGDYYDLHQYDCFAIFGSAKQNRQGVTTITAYHETEHDLFPGQYTAADLATMLFYNMTIGKFITVDELAAGDVIYEAGGVGSTGDYDGVQLFLVYNASKGQFTEFTGSYPNHIGDVTIAGQAYAYDGDAHDSFVSLNGLGYDDLDFFTFANSKSWIGKEVTYVPQYKSTNLAYMNFGSTAVNYDLGVILGFTYGSDYQEARQGVWHSVRTYTGVEVLNEKGEKVSYEFVKPFLSVYNSIGSIGDLVTLKLNADGKVDNVLKGIYSDFCLQPTSIEGPGSGLGTVPGGYFVDFLPTSRVSSMIKCNAALGRVEVFAGARHDIYTLASDAVIYMLTKDNLGKFVDAKVVSAADFLATASYQCNQLAVYKYAPNGNTINGLYLVNAVSADQKAVAIVTKASTKLIDGEPCYVLGTADAELLTVDATGSRELANAGVPSFIGYKTNSDGKVFDVVPIVHQAGEYTIIADVDIAGLLGAGYEMEYGQFADIYTTSVVDEYGQTLFMGEGVQFFDFTKNAATDITKIVEINNGTGAAATDLIYIYNAISHELAYVFVANLRVY